MDIAPSRQKLGIILEIKVHQKLKLKKKISKKWSPKLIFLNSNKIVDF